MKSIFSATFFIIAVLGSMSCNNKKSPAAAKPEKKNDTAVLTQTQDINPDSVLYSFVFMGCNRVDRKDLNNPGTNASTANLPQLQGTFNEVCNMNPRPKYFFFLGDLVLGLNTDTGVLSQQLAAWKQVYYDTAFSPISTSGIQMIAVPGNHEMLYYGKKKNGELPLNGSINAWMNQVGAFMPAGNPTLSRATGSQNQATYSFSDGATHFIIMNTDTYDSNNSQTIGLTDTTWINADLQTAGNNPAIKNIFLMGHKPIVTVKNGYLQNETGEHVVDASVRNSLWPMMNNYLTAELSAHVHDYLRFQPDSANFYQVIAGNGGSKGSATFYGYSIIYVMKNGSVVLKSMGRGYKHYMDPLNPVKYPTLTQDSVNLSHGSNSPDYGGGR
jgi:hypothetical protein